MISGFKDLLLFVFKGFALLLAANWVSAVVPAQYATLALFATLILGVFALITLAKNRANAMDPYRHQRELLNRPVTEVEYLRRERERFSGFYTFNDDIDSTTDPIYSDNPCNIHYTGGNN